MAQPILEVKNLTKRFGTKGKVFTAVDDISFHMNDGEILGLLGPNGAGKTTTIQMLLGILHPTAGEVRYFGKDLMRHREEVLEQVNFSSAYTNLPWVMSVKENLIAISYLYEIKNRKARLEKIVSLFRLESIMDKKISQLSSGQITRVNLAKSFLNFPKVLLLDEPTASLDPEVAKYIRGFLLEQRKEFSVSIIITSHNMAEVEEICDRVIFINGGKIIADDTPANLAKTIATSHIRLRFDEGFDRAKKYIKEQNIVYRTEGKQIICDVREQDIARFLTKLSDEKILYSEISIDKPSLEDFFLEVAKKK